MIDGYSSGFAISDATDPNHPLLYVNKAFEALSGYTAEDVLCRNSRLLSAEPEGSEKRVRLRKTVAELGPAPCLAAWW